MATKKTARKPVAKKTAVKAAPKTVAAAVSAPARSESKKGGIGWKKVFIFILGIIVGFGACCLYKGCCGKKMMWRHKPADMFVNGCFDLTKIKEQDKVQEMQLKDADKNGCITKEEFFGGDKPMPRAPRRMRRAPRPAPAR